LKTLEVRIPFDKFLSLKHLHDIMHTYKILVAKGKFVCDN
jgi:hypothetical protein